MSRFVKPAGQRIGRDESTEKLYVLEDKRDAAFKKAALELGCVLGHDPKTEYYTRTLPEALLSVLEAYEPEAARIAAQVFLQHADVRDRRFNLTEKSEAEYEEALAALADKWVAGCGGKETPFVKGGRRWLYVFNPKREEHGYLDLDTDVVLGSLPEC